MSHLGNEKVILEQLKKHLQKLQKYGCDYTTIDDFLREFVSRETNGYKFVDGLINKYRRIGVDYDPTSKKINVSPSDLKYHIAANIDGISDIHQVEDKNKLGTYLALFSLIGEIEKSYEHLMAQGIALAPCSSVKNAYAELFSLFDESKEHSGLVQKARTAHIARTYEKERFIHAIDRNANLESARILEELAASNGDREIALTFRTMNNYFESIGYHRNSKGCFDHTFRDIKLHSGLQVLKEEDIPLEQKIEYGLEIPNSERKIILSKTKKTR